MDGRFLPPNRVPLILSIGLLSVAVLSGVPRAGAETRLLQDAWNADAVETDGVWVLHLDPDVIYLGGLQFDQASTNRIHGHGAIIDLQTDNIRVYYADTRLDIDGCVLVNGGTSGERAALHYHYGDGHVSNCVFFGNIWGIHMHYSRFSSIRSCIFMENREWAAVLYDVITPELSFCDAYLNGIDQVPGDAGDYATWCGCPDDPVRIPYDPPGDTCIFQDPEFVNPGVDPETCDFHLAEGSPCTGAGYDGTDMGAYPEGDVPVSLTTWGKIKDFYRSGR